MISKRVTKFIFKKKSGITLIELLLALALSSLVLGIIYSLLLFGMRTYAKGNDQTELQFDIRLTADAITNELRYASLVEIHPDSLAIPATITDDKRYIYLLVEDGIDKLIIEGKDYIKKYPLGTNGQVLFANTTSDKVLSFLLSGTNNDQNYSIASEIAVLNLTKGKTIEDKSGIADGVKLVYELKLPEVNQQFMITSNSIPDGTINTFYDTFIITSGGNVPLDFSISSGSLPSGLTLSSTTGRLSGTPNTEGYYMFTVLVSDSSEPVNYASKSFSMVVIDPSLTAQAVADGITSITPPQTNDTILVLPYVPAGFEIYIQSVSPNGIVDEDGNITPPDAETTVNIILTVEKISTGETANTSVIQVIVPEKDESSELNYAPVAQNVSISGVAKVGNTLTGNYDFVDQDGDTEGASEYKWYRSSTSDGKNLIEVGTGMSYTVIAADEGKYLYFEVKPVAVDGILEGSPVISPPTELVAPVNSKPIVKDITISVIRSGNNVTLEANYTYEDVDGDLEHTGLTSFQWYYKKNKNHEEIISGATSRTYNVPNNYIPGDFAVEIKPYALTGVLEGDAVKSVYETVTKN